MCDRHLISIRHHRRLETCHVSLWKTVYVMGRFLAEAGIGDRKCGTCDSAAGAIHGGGCDAYRHGCGSSIGEAAGTTATSSACAREARMTCRGVPRVRVEGASDTSATVVIHTRIITHTCHTHCRWTRNDTRREHGARERERRSGAGACLSRFVRWCM